MSLSIPYTMKKLINLFLALLIIGLNTGSAQKADAVNTYRQANSAYQKMDYEGAINFYEGLVKGGNISPEVYFNLGNSYFKTGNVPRAIINYERAKKLAPEDEDINFNLKIASLKVVDRIDNVPEVFYKRWIHEAATLLPANNWSTIFIILVWLIFLSAGIYVISRSSVVKKSGFIAMIVFIILAIGDYMLSSRSYSIAHEEQQAIITSSSVYVKSSPDEKGNDLFILHEGTKVDVIEPFEGWNKIRIANGTIGWLKVKDIEKI